MEPVTSLVLAGAGSPPDVSWSPYVWTGLVLVAAIVYVAFRMRAQRAKRAIWAEALAGLVIATVGTTVLGFRAVNVPFDDPGAFCSAPAQALRARSSPTPSCRAARPARR